MKSLSIKTIEKMMADKKVDNSMMENLRADSRLGVKKLIKQFDKRVKNQLLLEEDFNDLKAFDQQYRSNEDDYIAGVDEAGRGPLAGPVVAAAVILPKDFKLLGLNDSKQINEANRKVYFDKIKEEAISFHVSVIDNKVIDQINILEATKRAMKESLLGLNITPNMALIDAVKLTQLPFQTVDIIKGDQKSLAIAAASILAKVTRDNIMEEIDEEYPMYGFKKHKGYGTKIHIDALNTYGACTYHRQSFAPVKKGD